MTHIALADGPAHESLLPLTFTRPVADIRMGILSMAERRCRLMPAIYSFATLPYLAEKYPADPKATEIADAAIIVGSDDGSGAPIVIRRPHDIFTHCGTAIEIDFPLVTQGRCSAPLSPTNTLIGPSGRLFIEEGATVEAATLNTSGGPIYIGAHVSVGEGSCLRGPIAIGHHSIVNMGTRIYGPTAIGPHCRIGGELNNVVIQGYSNKAHDGFLGNAVIGEWCNIGAGCNASNLKNDYTVVKQWSYPERRFLSTGLLHCGLVMGDHSKAGINTMLNTATVTGVGVNIHGTGFPRNFVASFSEGSASGFDTMPFKKFIDIARRVMARRQVELTETDEHLLSEVYRLTETYR
ncbi:MAG: hypothetical protein NC342_06800 [Pseudoflavonifractor sp.]|nr:glucose-1-phosphate thymidylyltransferase [Alloprevotella sp.]MCM1117226.1 hypothetical protein [Pseudoflavonifractor sp.]